MQALVIHPSPHKFFDYSNEFAFTSESLHHEFSSELKIDHHKVENLIEQQEQEFSFSCDENPKVSLITADEIFSNGKIRPLFHVFSSTSKQGLPLKTMSLDLVVEDSKETMLCKKSNSTGFSKMLRFRQDLKLRSYSNGNDTFVYLNPKKTNEMKAKNEGGIKNEKRKMAPSLASAHEKLYMMNKKRNESKKRRSFLPYKQQLLGFFTNMNGFSRNLHPF